MAKQYGSFTYNVGQLGRGANVAATTIMRSLFMAPEDTRTREMAEETIGVAMAAERSYDTLVTAQATMPEAPLTFEQFPHLLEASIQAATPTGAGPYVYTYEVPTGDAWNAIQVYTIRAGNKIVTADVQILPYCFVSEWSVKGEWGKAWTMAATWQAQQMSNGSLTAALTAPAVQEAIFNRATFYIDASGGTIGTTQVTGVIQSFEIQYTSGIVWVPAGDGSLYPIVHKHTRPEVKYTFVLEVEQDPANSNASTIVNERTAFRNNVVRLIRVNIPGTDATRNIRFDIPAKHDKVGPYEESDGDSQVTIEGHGVYSPTDALGFTVEVTNNLTAIP